VTIRPEDHAGLVYKYLQLHSRIWWMRLIEPDDQFQLGMIGVMWAARTYRKGMGTFANHAWKYIRGALWEHARTKGLCRWKEETDEAGKKRHRPGVRIRNLSDLGDGDREVEFGAETTPDFERYELIGRLIEMIPGETKQRVLWAWLVEDMTQSETADRLGMWEQRVYQIRRQAIKCWREAAEDAGSEGHRLLNRLREALE
jgi:RNA polymerase sigma factor (sigma-70 family)